MKALLPRLIAVTAAAILLTSAYYRTSSASIMTESANRLLVALSPEQRAKATFAFEDAERVNWFFVPIERKGLPLREMSPYQRHLASALLSAAALPRWDSLRMRSDWYRSPNSASSTSAVPSSDPSSATTIRDGGSVWASSARSVDGSTDASLCAAISTPTLGPSMSKR